MVSDDSDRNVFQTTSCGYGLLHSLRIIEYGAAILHPLGSLAVVSKEGSDVGVTVHHTQQAPHQRLLSRPWDLGAGRPDEFRDGVGPGAADGRPEIADKV